MPNGESGHAGTRPNDGFSPTNPVNAQGMRIEPPPSVPSVNGPMPAATAAAPPPDEPPGVFAVFHGLRVMPVRGLSVTPFQPNSGVVFFPTRTAPLSRRRATAGASSFHGPVGIDGFRAAQRRPALGEEDVLDGHRHAVERPFRLAAHPARFGLGRHRERVGSDEAERVQHRVEGVDALQNSARGLDRRGALAPIQAQQVRRRTRQQV